MRDEMLYNISYGLYYMPVYKLFYQNGILYIFYISFVITEFFAMLA